MVHAPQAPCGGSLSDPTPRAQERNARSALVLRAAVLALVVGAVLAVAITGSVPSTGRVREFGDGLGGAAPFVWPLVFALISVVVPWPISAGATGLLFGTALGTVLALTGVLVQAVVQFWLARRVAGEHLRRRVLERAPRVSAALERNGLLASFYGRIVPGLPWGMVNYAAGLSRVRLRELLLGTLAGGTPKVFAYVALGGSFGDLGRPEAIVAISLLVILALGGLVIARRGLLSTDAP